VDEVDLHKGEVTRRPVLKINGENLPVEAQTDAPQAGPVQTGPNPAGALMEAQLEDAPAPGEPESVSAAAGAVGESGFADPPDETSGQQEAMAEMTAFLLSPEGAALKRQAREAAHQVRTAAYRAAQAEIEQEVQALQERLAALDGQAQAGESEQDRQVFQVAKNVWQAVGRHADAAQQAFQAVQEKYTRVDGLSAKARLLLASGQMPQALVERLDGDCLAAAGELLAAAACHEQAQIEQARSKAALAALEQELVSVQAVYSAERRSIQEEIERLQASVKARQEQIAAGLPEVRLWQAVQKERRRREDEQAGRLIEQLPSQGIRKIMAEAARLGISQNASLLSAVSERQRRVNYLIEFCREKAETLSAFPEALPEGAYALLVRGDTIRAVDADGRELAVLYTNSDGTELTTVRSKNGRRWKLDGDKDIYVIKK
jgi:hypothetical protein